MKKGKYGTFLLLFASLSFIIATVEGYLYYSRYEEFGFFRILITLQNSIKAFLFSPLLTVEKVLDSLLTTTAPLELFFGFAYVIAVFVAPLCTATALALAIRRLFYKKFRLWMQRKDEAYILLGYNENVKRLLKNQQRKNVDGPSPMVFLLSRHDLPEEEELALLRQNIFFFELDLPYASDQQLRSFFRKVRMKRIQKIFLLEDSSMQNVSLYMQLQEKAICWKGDPLLEFHKDAICYCRCTETHARELAIDFYDDTLLAAEEAGNKAVPPVGLYLFDIAELRVRKSFDKHSLWSRSDCAHTANAFDAHILIVGFGRVGEQTLRQAINLGVAHSQSRIRIDVVDLDALEKKAVFAGTFSPDYSVEDPADPHRIRIGSPVADGLLEICFYDIDVRKGAFSTFLREQAARMPYTYAAVCINDVDIGIQSITSIERYACSAAAFPITVKMEYNDQLAAYLDKNQNTYQNIISLGSSHSVDALCLDDIINDQTEEKARAYHEIYRRMHLHRPGEPEEDDAPWEKLPYYRQNANRLLCHHSKTLDFVLDSLFLQDNAISVLRQQVAELGLVSGDGISYTFDFPEETLMERISAHPVLGELARLEHRRWCYVMLLSGWSGQCSEKNAAKKENPCICDWDTLCRIKPHTAKYDLLPLLMRCRSDLPELAAALFEN